MERGGGEAGRDWGVGSEVLGLRWHVGIGVSGEGCEDWVLGVGCHELSAWIEELGAGCWEWNVGSGMLGAACVCTGVKG